MKHKRSGVISIVMVALIAAMLALPLPALGQPVTSLVKGNVILNGETLAPGPNVRISVEGSATQGTGTADGTYYEISLIGTASDAGKLLSFELNVDGLGWMPANWDCIDCAAVPPAFESWGLQEIDLALGAILPAVSFNVANVDVNEGDTATIEVVLSEPGTQTISVDYETQDGTAVAPGDYSAQSGTLWFSVGQVSQTFPVPAIDDALFEGNEVLNVVLSNPTNARMGAPNPATVTIIDNDVPAVSFESANFDVVEGNAATVTVVLEEASTDIITVDYATADIGSAAAGVDYTAVSGQLTFNPGQVEKTFQVPTAPDMILEGFETFNVVLSNPVNTMLGSPNPATVTIDDNTPVSGEWFFGADHVPLIAPFPANGRPALGDDLPIDNIVYAGDWFQILKYDENDDVPGCDWLTYVSGLQNDGPCSLTTLVPGEYYYVVVSDASQPLQW